MKGSTGFYQSVFGTASVRSTLAYGRIRFYTGTAPATADSALTGTLLGEATVDGVTFVPDTPNSGSNGLTFAAPVAGVMSKTPSEIWQFSGVTNGTVGYAVYLGNATDSGGASTSLVRILLTVGVSTGEVQLATLSITSGSTNIVQSCTFTKP